MKNFKKVVFHLAFFVALMSLSLQPSISEDLKHAPLPDGGFETCDSEGPFDTTNFSFRIDRPGPNCVYQCMDDSSWSCTYAYNYCDQC